MLKMNNSFLNLILTQRKPQMTDQSLVGSGFFTFSTLISTFVSTLFTSWWSFTFTRTLVGLLGLSWSLLNKSWNTSHADSLEHFLSILSDGDVVNIDG
mmetsp:Transcript_52436/g.60242  ORF Transcript_52436/g.60242 Transcript_52436/m.60242 type:complete len:98 (+) Transcript_52436:89-382(+)